MRQLLVVIFSLCLSLTTCFAQSESATLSGRVTDASGSVIAGAEIVVLNVDTGVSLTTVANDAGVYIFPSLSPGNYQLTIRARGFREVVKTGLVLHVQDRIAQNTALQIGSVDQRVTVSAEGVAVNTTDASVSTVVDRQFLSNIPLNGRSVQSLVELTPGATMVPGDPQEPGQFSFNGQRPSANYFTVDGVSANVGVNPEPAPNQSSAGATPAFSVSGGTNGLVSVDAMQEFRIQTSTYAPEFGRTPGGQISIVSRSGTNSFHGTVFDYLRNDALDANDWFANHAGLPKAEERQNDFGGVFGGPIWRDRTFFFFSYEGLRLRLPEVATSLVPGAAARTSAPAAMQPFLNVFPMPTGPDNPDGTAPFSSDFSDPSTLDAVSIRIDQVVSSRLHMFARYNRAPSSVGDRANGTSLNTINFVSNELQTATVGATAMITAHLLNDFRVNYSHNGGSSRYLTDSLGGAGPVPGDSTLFPTGFTSANSRFAFQILSLGAHEFWDTGTTAANVQRQLNLVDSLTWQKGNHGLKFGGDWRRLSPNQKPLEYSMNLIFTSVAATDALSPLEAFVLHTIPSTIDYNNLGLFMQDTWRVHPRLTLTYGIRWDTDFAPTAANGPSLLALTQVHDISTTAVAPAGTPVFHTTYGNFAPRIGLAYQVSQKQQWNTVLRGGFGMFYDLASNQVGQQATVAYPYGAVRVAIQPGFPIPSAIAAPPDITPNFLNEIQFASDPQLKLPYSLQWNVALEQELGANQVVTATYVGQVGRRLLQSQAYFPFPNPNFLGLDITQNTATSDYHALQLQFQRRLSHGLQALTSYTFAHSIDTASANEALDSNSGGGAFVPNNNNRASSDFDIRQTFAAAITYDVPRPHVSLFVDALARDWSIDNIFQARTAPPVDIEDIDFFGLSGRETFGRPDRVPGTPTSLADPTVAGGRRINPNAFTAPPAGMQGDLGRNALRGFGAYQWDFAVRREFALPESVRLQARFEFFNILNHPNFAQPQNEWSSDPLFISPDFGTSQQMLARQLGGTFSSGLSPLYQIGGPRSIQIALKLNF